MQNEADVPYNSQEGGSMRIYSYCERETAYIKHPGELPFNYIIWRGFSASVDNLLAEGWQIKQYYNPYTKKIVLKLINPEAQMVGTVKVTAPEYRKLTELRIDNLHAGGTAIRKSQPQLESCELLTPDDVGGLLEAVNMLLSPEREKYIKSTTLPSADIKQIKEFLKTKNDKKELYKLHRQVG